MSNFIYKATVSQRRITASDVTQTDVVKASVTTRQIISAARFVNRLLYRESDALALLDLLGINLSKPFIDSTAIVDIVELRAARGPQRAFNDPQLIDDFIAFLLYVNRSFTDVVQVQQYLNLLIEKSADSDIVEPADSRYFDLSLGKIDAVTETDVHSLFIYKSSDGDNQSTADQLTITSNKALLDRFALNSYFTLQAGLGVFNTVNVDVTTRIDTNKFNSDAVATVQRAALKITKPAEELLLIADANFLGPNLGKFDSVDLSEQRLGFFINKGLGDNQPMTDLFGVFDGLIYAMSFQLFNATAVTDAFARSWQAHTRYLDEFSLGDSVIPQLGRPYFDSTEIVDLRSTQFTKSSADFLVEIDTVSRQTTKVRADAFNEYDTLALFANVGLQHSIIGIESISKSAVKTHEDIQTFADTRFLNPGKSFNHVISGDVVKTLLINKGIPDAAVFEENQNNQFIKYRNELITTTLLDYPSAPATPDLSSYTTLSRSVLEVRNLSKVEIGGANIYNTTDVSGGRLLFSGYPGTRYVDFSPVSSTAANGSDWDYNLAVEFYGGTAGKVNGLEAPDVGEDLVLLYSLNNGISFTTAQTLWAGADDWISTVGSSLSLTVNATVTAAVSSNLIWRIAQFNYSNPGFDQYAVVRAQATNSGSAAKTTVFLNDLIAIYDFAIADHTLADHPIYITDSVFVYNLRPRRPVDDVTIIDSGAPLSVFKRTDGDLALLEEIFQPATNYIRSNVFNSTVFSVALDDSVQIIIPKFFDDSVTMLDLAGIVDGLLYTSTLFRYEELVIADVYRQVFSARRRFTEEFAAQNSDNIGKFVSKPAKQALLFTVNGWGTSISRVANTTGDFVVIGDPTALPVTNAAQSRRSGTSLENFKYTVDKPLATTPPYGTNLLQYSEELATLFGGGTSEEIAYSIAAAGASFNNDYFVAPDRTVSGDRINTTSTAGIIKYDVSVSGNTTYTWSFWALKTVAGGNTYLGVRDHTYGNYSISPTDYQPELSLSSWTRIARTFTTAEFTQSVGLQFIVGSSNSIGLWGWSLQLGSSVGPYIRTTSAAIIRSGVGTGIENNTTYFDDRIRLVVPFRRLFQDGQEAFERSFKELKKPIAGVDTTPATDSINLATGVAKNFIDLLGDRDPYGTVALVDRGVVRMTNYVEDIDYFAEDYTGVQRNLSNFYYPPINVNVNDIILISDEVSFITGKWFGIAITEPIGDLDPFGNINTLINRGTLRITNYVEDIDYFESDYIGESRTIS